jgi:low density lipoprotein-related protein 2
MCKELNSSLEGSKYKVIASEIDRSAYSPINSNYYSIKRFCRWFLLQIKVMDVNGGNINTLLSQSNNIAHPKALAVLDSRLYYLDPSYEKIERVDLPKGDNPKLIIDNEADLKTFTIFRKRRSELQET